MSGFDPMLNAKLNRHIKECGGGSGDSVVIDFTKIAYTPLVNTILYLIQLGGGSGEVESLNQMWETVNANRNFKIKFPSPYGGSDYSVIPPSCVTSGVDTVENFTHDIVESFELRVSMQSGSAVLSICVLFNTYGHVKSETGEVYGYGNKTYITVAVTQTAIPALPTEA